MPKRVRRLVQLPKKLTMEQCKAIRKRLDREIKKLSLAEQRELSNYIREKEKEAAKAGKELQPGIRNSLITYWFVKKGKKV